MYIARLLLDHTNYARRNRSTSLMFAFIPTWYPGQLPFFQLCRICLMMSSGQYCTFCLIMNSCQVDIQPILRFNHTWYGPKPCIPTNPPTRHKIGPLTLPQPLCNISYSVPFLADLIPPPHISYHSELRTIQLHLAPPLYPWSL